LYSIKEEMKGTGISLTAEGEISEFLGVKIEHKDDGTIPLMKPQLKDSLLKELLPDREDTKSKDTLAASSMVLGSHPESQALNSLFNYGRAIGKLKYREKINCPAIEYPVQQCARFQRIDMGRLLPPWYKGQGYTMRPREDSFYA
jgi:hypothetical protein